jgi:hypothetical protein
MGSDACIGAFADCVLRVPGYLRVYACTVGLAFRAVGFRRGNHFGTQGSAASWQPTLVPPLVPLPWALPLLPQHNQNIHDNS